MTPSTSYRLLWIAATAMFGMALLVIALALSMPIAPVSVEAGTPGALATAAAPRQHISREQLEHDASRPLRQPLVDAAPPAQSSPLAAPVPPFPPLVGTIVEPGRSVALVQMPGSSIRFVRIGDRVADAQILAIDISGITVARQGQTVFIRIAHADLPATAKRAGT